MTSGISSAVPAASPSAPTTASTWPTPSPTAPTIRGGAAAEAGASDNLRTHAGHVSAIAAGLLANAREAAGLARQLADAVSIRRAAPLVARVRALAYQIAEGFDVNGDGRMSFDGEAGMQQLEAHLYLLLEGEALPRELR